MIALPPGLTPTEVVLLEALVAAEHEGEPTTTTALCQRTGWNRSRVLRSLHDLRDRNRVQNHRDDDGAPLGWATVCWTCDGDGAVFHGSMEQLCPSCDGQGPALEGGALARKAGRGARRQAAAVALLTALDDQGPARLQPLADAIGWSSRSTSILLRELVAEGHVLHEGWQYLRRSRRAGRANHGVGEAPGRAPTVSGHPAPADQGIGGGSGGASC